MKMHVIHDQKGDVVGALRTAPQRLPDGREIAFVPRLHEGQKAQIVEVPDHLKGSDLLQHLAKLRPNSRQ